MSSAPQVGRRVFLSAAVTSEHFLSLQSYSMTLHPAFISYFKECGEIWLYYRLLLVGRTVVKACEIVTDKYMFVRAVWGISLRKSLVWICVFRPLQKSHIRNNSTPAVMCVYQKCAACWCLIASKSASLLINERFVVFILYVSGS